MIVVPFSVIVRSSSFLKLAYRLTISIYSAQSGDLPFSFRPLLLLFLLFVKVFEIMCNSDRLVPAAFLAHPVRPDRIGQVCPIVFTRQIISRSMQRHLMGDIPGSLHIFHIAIGTSQEPLPAADKASCRFNSRASRKVTLRLSINSSFVSSWQLTPGTSSIQPIHHPPSCFTTAVYCVLMARPLFRFTSFNHQQIQVAITLHSTRCSGTKKNNPLRMGDLKNLFDDSLDGIFINFYFFCTPWTEQPASTLGAPVL